MSTHPGLDKTLGAAFVGVVAAAILHGVSCVQAWYYYTHQRDSWPIKALVGAVMAFDTIHQALITHTVYTYLVSNWGDTAFIQRLVWSMLVEVLFNGLTGLLVQSFLTMRVWRLSNRKVILTGICSILVVAEFGCVVTFTAMSLHLETFVQLAKLKYLSILVNALAAAGDVLIAGTLCVLLHRSRTGFERSDTMINKLILFAVNTGLLTSICACASLISITVAGETFLYIGFFFCIGRLYTNSLLATLNARKMIRGAGNGTHSTSDAISLSVRDFPKNGPMGSTRVCGLAFVRLALSWLTSLSHQRPTDISIKIDTTREFATDSDHGHGNEKSECGVVGVGVGVYGSVDDVDAPFKSTASIVRRYEEATSQMA